MSDTNEIEIPEAHAAILAANTFGVVSTLREKDGLISTNPVSYVWDGECVRISTIKGRVKYANLLANPMVTFCVVCLLYTSPSPRDKRQSRMPSSA